MKPAVIIAINLQGIPECLFCGDVGEAHERARRIKKADPMPGVAEVYCLSARGVEDKIKFRHPQAEPVAIVKPEKPRHQRQPA